MPTGYTADVATGKLTDFKAFAMQCVRAMGVCITMRDDPMDAPIPDEFPASDYHVKALAAARLRLETVLAMTEADWEVAAEKKFDEACASRTKALAERAEQQARYEAMLISVLGWKPPTDEHIGMKNFMEQQLRESIKFDCSTSYYQDLPKRLTGIEWRDKEVASANRDVAYHVEHQAEEVKRANERTAWIRDLRKSLA